jgi:hypothetical protein
LEAEWRAKEGLERGGQMSRAGDEFGGLAQQRSSWLIPLVVFFVTACLSAIVFAYYFAPGPPGLGEEMPSPTDATGPVTLTLGPQHFRIPANYILLSSARRGGALNELSMAAVLPGLQGYSPGAAQDFAANAPDSHIVTITVKSSPIPAPEQERLDRIYLMQVVDSGGQIGPFDLKQYSFRPDSGYHAEDLFVGSTEAGPIVLLCDRPSAETPSPNCLRDMPLGQNLALSYRFKRVQLAQWRTIDAGLRGLLSGFFDKN